MKLPLFLLLAFSVFSCAAQEKKGAEIFQKNGLAINGYDPVTFFTMQEPVKGSAEFTTTWKEAVWQFSSRENLDSFQTNPEKYAPQYGGYCAYGTADGEGHKAPTQPDTWTIIDGKLYFNYNQKVKKLWEKDRPGMIEKANKNWENIRYQE